MLTILIVDDEKLERNGIKFLLKREKEEFFGRVEKERRR